MTIHGKMSIMLRSAFDGEISDGLRKQEEVEDSSLRLSLIGRKVRYNYSKNES